MLRLITTMTITSIAAISAITLVCDNAWEVEHRNRCRTPPPSPLFQGLFVLPRQGGILLSWVDYTLVPGWLLVGFINPLAPDACQLRNLTSIPRKDWSGSCMLSTVYFSMARLSFRLPLTGSSWLSWSSWSQPNSTSSLAPSPPLETSRPPSHMNLQHMGQPMN